MTHGYSPRRSAYYAEEPANLDSIIAAVQEDSDEHGHPLTRFEARQQVEKLMAFDPRLLPVRE